MVVAAVVGIVCRFACVCRRGLGVVVVLAVVVVAVVVVCGFFLNAFGFWCA